MPVPSPKEKREGKIGSDSKEGLTDRGLFRLLRPVRQCRPSNNALSFHRESTKQQNVRPDWGKAGKGERA